MRITFLMPCYCWVPSGGFRVVYEYANQLVARGHRVTVIHPRRLAFPPEERFTLRQRLRRIRLAALEARKRPDLHWHKMDSRVRLEFVATSSASFFPDADVIFATAWHTVKSVLALPCSKGRKCHLIQGYETFLGPREEVDASWRAPLRKVVISMWLADIAKQLDAGPVTCIPNGIDHRVYRLLLPLAERPARVAMTVSPVSVKGSRDGVTAVTLARKSFPGLQAVCFGTIARPQFLPEWTRYLRNPPQEQIVEDVYNASAIFVSPSLSEGFSLPAAEAASSGCAIVATYVGGLREYLEHGVNGLLSPPGDPEALARNVCTLLANPDLRIQLARAARERISQFTWSRSTDLMEAFLQDVVSGRPIPFVEGAVPQAVAS